MMGVTIQDYRRTDLRVNTSGEPFWIRSKTVDGHEVSGLKDKACVLFSFPIDGQQILIREIAVHVLRGFTTSTTLEVGTYTLATENVSTNDTATEVVDNAFVQSGDITATSVGWYYPTVGDFVDSRKTGVTIEGGTLLVGASTTVPAVVVSPKVATIIIGQVQVCMLISIIPGS
jgi:hypothetical protein